MIGSKKYDWSICILSSRETCSTLLASIEAAVLASNERNTLLDVVINGNTDLTNNLVKALALKSDDGFGNRVRVFNLNLGDKASAWNTYIHNIWVGSDLVFFMDGYARPCLDALLQIEHGLTNKPEALASTGVPTMGHSADYLREGMLREGGIHGNLFAIKGNVCLDIKAAHFFLPVGIYRTDSTIAAVLAYNLDPKRYTWNLKERIFVNQDATWLIDDQKLWSVGFFKSLFKRRIRQAQGNLENLAIREHFSFLKKSPMELPRFVDELISSWVKRNLKQSCAVFIRNPMTFFAFLRLLSGGKKLRLEPDSSELSAIAEGVYKGL